VAVKSAKFHVRHILVGHNFTFEELITVLYEIEACLSNRPLVPVIAPSSEGVD